MIRVFQQVSNDFLRFLMHFEIFVKNLEIFDELLEMFEKLLEASGANRMLQQIILTDWL